MKEDSESFIFIFNDNRRIILSQNQVLNISTTFYYKHINKENGNIITLPDNISYESFTEFVDIYQKNSPILEEQISQENKLIVNENVDLVQLIQMSEYFENETFSIFLINELFLYGENKINKKNSYMLLILSFNKLNELNNNNNYNNEEDIECVWLDLFMKSLDVVGKNLLSFFTDGKLDVFDKKIIDELFEKFSMNLISNDFIINSQENKSNENILKSPNQNNNEEQNNNNNNNNEKNENSNIHNINTINKENIDKIIHNDNKSNDEDNVIQIDTFRKIIEFLINRRSQNDFFCLLSNEFMKISSEENINEINNLPNPTFLLKLDVNEINNYYEEFPIENQINNNEQKKIVFIINYKKMEDSFNVSLKLTKLEKQSGKNNSNNMITNNNLVNTFDILTFLSSVSIEELDIKQINIKSIANNKSMHEIFKINNFSKLLSSVSNEYLTLKIFLKPCYTHSMLCSYLYYNFEQLYDNKNIFKIPKSLLNTIIRKKQVNNNDINMDKMVICLFNWLNDEINIREDISEIIENIKWNNISLPLLFEFIIKYAKNISQVDLEHIFLNSLSGRSQNYSSIEAFGQEIIKSLLTSAKKMDYISLFCENQKLNKFNSYEIINHERNVSLNLNESSQKKISLENKNTKNSNSKISEPNLINNLNKKSTKENKENNDSIIINSYAMKKKQNKSTTNLNNIKLIESKKNDNNLSKKKIDIINSPKEKHKKSHKKISKNNSNYNQRNKSSDLKYMNSNKIKTSNYAKKHQRIYLETNYNKNIFNKSLYDNKIYKIINNKNNNNENGKKSISKISLITELNKIKLKVKPNSNQILQKKQKHKNRINYSGNLNKTDNNFC